MQISAMMSDSKSFNCSLLEVMISCANKHTFIHDLSNLALQIISNAWWASMTVGFQCPIT